MQSNEEKHNHAMSVIEKYFDTDIDNADSAMDVLLDNDVDPVVGAGIVRDMFPEEAHE